MRTAPVPFLDARDVQEILGWNRVVQANAFAARLRYMAFEFARLTAQDVASVADGGETPIGDVQTVLPSQICKLFVKIGSRLINE
jgi:hypothetical protein